VSMTTASYLDQIDDRKMEYAFENVAGDGGVGDDYHVWTVTTRRKLAVAMKMMPWTMTLYPSVGAWGVKKL
jgi:hypothetical protein